MAQPSQPQQNQPQYAPIRGIVKQVSSGDTVIIRGQPKGGPPPEKTLSLAYVIAPKLGRRPPPNAENQAEIKDEPYSWEAREFLRKKLIGKEVYFLIEYKVPSATNREFGVLYLGKDVNGENMNEAIVSEGLVEIRKTGQKQSDVQSKLCELEETARSAGKGKWISDSPSSHIREVKHTVENLRNFVDSFHKKPVKAIIEHVRDGSTVRCTLLPDYYSVIIVMSGIRCPISKDGVPETHFEEAKFYTESRLLHRDIEIVLESVSNNSLIGSILHPNGSIAELLLKEGLAKCVDWSITFVTNGAEKLRAAEKIAKEKRLRIWKDYSPAGVVIQAKDKEFQGKVTEVMNADALGIKSVNGQIRKIFLSSIRPPRLSEEKPTEGGVPKEAKKSNFRPLYDIPYMYEAREFLRKKLIGKRVNVVVDYIQPASTVNNYPEKICCTVTIGGINVAETLVGKGLATVVRYRQDDDQRSMHYDELLAAEMKAQKSGKGLHGKKDTPLHRVVDLSGDQSKSKQFLPFLQRAGKVEAIVEFIASGSRLRLYIPRENCLITFLLGGISCPRASRTQGTAPIQGEPWGDEAMVYTKDLCLQREVEIEVESMDKAGNFIGWLWVEEKNLSVELVGESLAKVHFTAERSPYARDLQIKEHQAKTRRDKIWSDFEEPKNEDEIKEDIDKERKVNYRKGFITEIKPDLHFYIQYEEDGPKVEELLTQLRQELTSNPPLPGSYVPKRGDTCAALFTDNLWYRAKVEKIAGTTINILYIDYGNREVTDSTKLALLPGSFKDVTPAAHELAFACIKLPSDVEVLEEARHVFHHDADNRLLKVNVEYRAAGVDYVTLMTEDNEDVVKGLLGEGLLLVESRREKRFQKFLKEYELAEDAARKKRLNLWQYGDFTEDDAKEFGYQI